MVVGVEIEYSGTESSLTGGTQTQLILFSHLISYPSSAILSSSFAGGCLKALLLVVAAEIGNGPQALLKGWLGHLSRMASTHTQSKNK